MIRINNIESSLDFYCHKLGLIEISRYDSEKGRFTLIFLAAPDDVERARGQKAPKIEMTYHWDTEAYAGGRNFGHTADRVDNINATCQQLVDQGQVINRQPRDVHRAFLR